MDNSASYPHFHNLGFLRGVKIKKFVKKKLDFFLSFRKLNITQDFAFGFMQKWRERLKKWYKPKHKTLGKKVFLLRC